MKGLQKMKYCVAILLSMLVFMSSGCGGSSSPSPSPSPDKETPIVDSVSPKPLGTAPTYLQLNVVGILTTAPAHKNKPAITKNIWVPQLDQGYDPQGLAYNKGVIYVSAYNSHAEGGCRVFAINSVTGATEGYFDMPSSCHHAGGLTMIGQELGRDILVVADTYTLYKIDVAKALELKSADDGTAALLATVKLSKEGTGPLMKGSFIDFDKTYIWLGTNATEDIDNSRAYKLAPDIFTQYNGSTIDKSVAKTSIPIPLLANGMGIDNDGAMWITGSNSQHGILYKLDITKGCQASSATECIVPGSNTSPPHYNIPIGSEDLSFDENGKLWTVSESGCLQWRSWLYSYAFVYQIDTSKLLEP